MSVRILTPGDLPEAMALVRTVFMEFEAPGYIEEGITHFLEFIREDAMCDRMEAGDLTLWGHFSGDEMVGVIASRRGEHISLLFVRRDMHRRGIATRLFGAVLDHFPSPDGVTVNASPYGHGAYCRMGFMDTGPETTINGIMFIPMIYHRQA